MKRAMYLGLSIVLLTASGCATEGYVKEQVDMVCKRVSDLEAKVNGLEDRMNKMPTTLPMNEQDKAMLDKALQDAKASAANADAAAGKADAAASRAEAAAGRAEQAAKKGSKLLELEQKK